MADSFASTVDGRTATFHVLYEENGGGRQVKGEGLVSIRPLPWGGGAVIQSAGRMPITRSFRVRVDSQSDLGDLLHCRGDHGNFTSTEISADCTLLSVESTAIDPDLQHQDATVNLVFDTLDP